MNVHMVRISAMALFTMALATAYVSSLAYAQDTVVDFSASPPSGQYSFKSWTPKTVPDLIKGNASGEG